MPNKTILHVEDDENDVFFVQRAMSKAGLDVQVQVTRDGQQALDYLSGQGDYSDRNRYPVPDVLLLDLKLPVLGGFEVLTWARRHPQFSKSPIFMLSSSDNQSDIQKAEELGADKYFVKTHKFEDLISHLRDVLQLS